MGWSRWTGVLMGLCLATVAFGQPAEVPYETDFESAVGPEWSTDTTESIASLGTWLRQSTDNNGNQHVVSLQLKVAPKVEYALVFDLGIFDQWVGMSAGDRDRFEVSVDGKTLFSHQFAYQQFNRTFDQNVMWLDRYDKIAFDSREDMIFRDVTLRFTAAREIVTIQFLADLYPDGKPRSWAIDNVRVVQAGSLSPQSAALSVDWLKDIAYVQSVESLDFSQPQLTEKARQIAWLPTRSYVNAQIGSDRFAWRARGLLAIPAAGTWEFRLMSDDGSTLRLNEEIVISNDGLHSPRYRTASRQLQEGVYRIDVRGFEWGGQATLILEWRGPGQNTWSVIPPSAFVLSESDELPLTDVTAEAGLKSPSQRIILSQAWCDLNADGFQDLIIGGSSSRIFLGGPDGTFRSPGSLPINYYQPALCDADRDGDMDYVSAYSGLFENDGTGRFAQRNFPGGITRYSLGIAAPDFDQDGWSDLVGTWGWTTFFARNSGPGTGGSWIEYTASGFSTLFDRVHPRWFYGAMLDIDLNDDGRPDVMHADASQGLEAILSTEQGYELAQIMQPVTGGYNYLFSMCAAADIDSDGDIDLFNGSHPNGTGNDILINDGAGAWALDSSRIPDCSTMQWSAATFGDIDNDGDLDIVLCSLYRNTVEVRLNDGLGSFAPVTTQTLWPRYPIDVRLVDYDNDGDLDLAVIGLLEVRLLRNDIQSDQWFKVRVVNQAGSNAAAIGTRVDLIDPDTQTLLARRDVSSTSGFGAGPFELHFGGVDPAHEYIVRASFPSGVVEQRVVPEQVTTAIGRQVLPRLLTIEAPTGRGRRVARWQETNQRATIIAALRAEIRRRGLGADLAALRELGLDSDVRQLLQILGARTVREALGEHAAVLTDLARDPHRP